MKVKNYVTLEFLSRSTNEAFARTAAAAFAAQLDLAFTGAAGEEGAPGTKKDTYFDKLKELWAFYHEGTSLYRYA